MTMSEAPMLVLAGVVGGLLGVLFYGGLWWTVQKGAVSEQPALWFFGSLMLRMGIVLTGFYLVSGGQWERLVLSLVGFVMARIVVTRLTRPSVAILASSSEAISHASYSGLQNG